MCSWSSSSDDKLCESEKLSSKREREIHVVIVSSFSHVRLFSAPWTAARQASLSFTVSWSLFKLMSFELVIASNHVILSSPSAAFSLSQHQTFFFFSFIFISWRLITLQYCSGFCHTLRWISHGFTCVPHPDPPSHLPFHLIPLGLPSAPGPSTCLMHPAWAGDLSLFQWVDSSHQVARVFELQLQHQHFQWIFRVDFL